MKMTLLHQTSTLESRGNSYATFHLPRCSNRNATTTTTAGNPFIGWLRGISDGPLFYAILARTHSTGILRSHYNTDMSFVLIQRHNCRKTSSREHEVTNDANFKDLHHLPVKKAMDDATVGYHDTEITSLMNNYCTGNRYRVINYSIR